MNISNTLHNDTSEGVIAFAEQLKQQLINWNEYPHVIGELGQDRPNLQNDLNALFLSVYEKFLTFLNDADATSSAINTWKEIERFLADYADTGTLKDIVDQLNANIESRLSVVLENSTGSSTTNGMSQKAITDALDTKQDVIQDLSNIRSGVAKVGYYECSTQDSSAAKSISADNYVLSTGGSMKVKMVNANTADNATLNINNTGAKPLYYAGEIASSINSWKAGETVEVYYDGTNFYANNVTGSSDCVFDISAKTGQNYETLNAALTAANSVIPTSKKKGGMSIKFIKPILATYSVEVEYDVAEVPALSTSIDNSLIPAPGIYNSEDLENIPNLPSTINMSKVYYATIAPSDNSGISDRYNVMTVKKLTNEFGEYMQYRLMTQTFSTSVSDWQGVDDEPTVGSKNLVKSGGVANLVDRNHTDTIKLARCINGTEFTQPTQDDVLRGNLLADGRWNFTDVDRLRSIVIDIENYVGLEITVEPIDTTMQYAFLSEFNQDGISIFAQGCQRENTYPSNTIIPEGTKYIYLLCKYVIGGSVTIPKIYIPLNDGSVNEVIKLEDAVLGELPCLTLDDVLIGNMYSDGSFVIGNTKSAVIPIKNKFRGANITVTSDAEQTKQYAFLQNFNKNGYSQFCSGCQRESTYPNNVTIPDDCNYLYLLLPNFVSQEMQERMLPKIALEDTFYSKGILRNLEEQKDNITELAESLETTNKAQRSEDYNLSRLVSDLDYVVNGETFDYVTKENVITGNIYADGSFSVGAGNTRSLILPINKMSRGKKITVTSDIVIKQYAFLQNFDILGKSQFCSGCQRESTYPNNVTIPDDCNYLYLQVTDGGDIGIVIPKISINNAEDGLYSIKNLVREIDLKTENFTKEIDLITNDVLEVSYMLKGTSTSKIVFNQPIILSRDGDSLEFVAIPYVTDNGAYSFGKRYENPYYSIALSDTILKIRDLDGTTFLDFVPDTEEIKVKIEYSNGGMKFYVNDELKESYNTQSTITLESIGNAGNAQYGYWNGIIKSVIYNGVDLNLLTQGLFDIDFLTGNENVDYPECVVNWDLSKFTIYSRINQTKYYAMLEMVHKVDHSELEYTDLWRLFTYGGIYEYKHNTLYPLNIQLLISSENEFAFRYANTSDFTGGYHGDERIDIDEKCYADFYINGIKLTSAELQAAFTKTCNNFELRQLSTLHETSIDGTTPVENHPIIAYHYKTTKIQNAGFVSTNRLDFDLSNSNLSSVSTTTLFTGLVCANKDCATFVESDTGEIIEMTGSNETTTFNGVDKKKSITLLYKGYNPTTKLSVEIDSKELTPNVAASQYFSVWDRSTDSKYYGYAANRTFQTGDIYCAEHSVKWDLYREKND